jgi:secretion/DNA translocation related TadE-like protein
VIRTRSRNERGRHSEEGSATVWVLGCSAVLACAGLFVGAVGMCAVSRHRTAMIADLAALAAAQRAASGSDGCVAARLVTQAQDATLAQCTADAAHAGVVSVVVEQRPVGLLAGLGTVRVRSRAGPSGVR